MRMPWPSPSAALIAALFVFSGPRVVHSASFTISYFDAPPAAQAAIEHAAGIWGGILVSDVPIKVSVSWFPLGASALGVTFPNGIRDFAGAPMAQTMYATSLANSIAGLELNAGQDDINVYLNSGTNWYFGLDGNTPAGQYDLVSVALHELGHGLGFVGLSKKVGSEGSLGMVLASDFAPLITTFPWPEQDGFPGIFDRFLTDQGAGPLILMPNPGNQLGQVMTGNQMYFNGANTMAVNNGQPSRIYAPSVFALGSSCVHLNESTYPAGNPNELMTPFSSAGQSSHWPGPICLAMMRDIGWDLMPGVGVEELAQGLTLSVYPNPAGDRITVGTRPGTTLIGALIIDTSGRSTEVETGINTIGIYSLSSGLYTIILKNGSKARFVKE